MSTRNVQLYGGEWKRCETGVEKSGAQIRPLNCSRGDRSMCVQNTEDAGDGAGRGRYRGGLPLPVRRYPPRPQEEDAGVTHASCQYREGHARQFYAPAVTRETAAAADRLPQLARGDPVSPFIHRALHRNGLRGLDRKWAGGAADRLPSWVASWANRHRLEAAQRKVQIRRPDRSPNHQGQR